MNRLRLIPILVCLVPVVAAGEEASFASPKATMKTLLTILRDGELNRVAEPERSSRLVLTRLTGLLLKQGLDALVITLGIPAR